MSNVILTWVLPTLNSDGSPVAGVASVHVYESGAIIATLPTAATTYTVVSPAAGSHFYTVSVTDTLGRSSSQSATVATVVAAPPPVTPNAPTSLTAVQA
jgi:hypothetical protein